MDQAEAESNARAGYDQQIDGTRASRVCGAGSWLRLAGAGGGELFGGGAEQPQIQGAGPFLVLVPGAASEAFTRHVDIISTAYDQSFADDLFE